MMHRHRDYHQTIANNTPHLTTMSSNDATDMEPNNISMDSVVEGTTDRGIPIVKYIEDIGGFAEQFTPPASAELLIGAYTDLFSKFKNYEARLTQKSADFKQKIPEIEESLAVVKKLKTKQDQQEVLVTRYSLSDAGVFAKAEVDTDSGLVGLWLGANVMLEYTYEDAIELLISKEEKAKKEFEEVKEDLAFTRNQIITAEVNISRIYNWDVRRKRDAAAKREAAR